MTKNKFFLYIMTLYKRYTEHYVFSMSAELAYFFLLSLFPLLLVVANLLHYFPFSIDDVLDIIDVYAPGETIEIIRSNVYQIIGQQSKTVLSVGILFTLFFASNGLNAIMRAFNRAYGIKETRNYFVVRGISILLTIVIVFLIVFALLVPVFGKSIGGFIFKIVGAPETFYKVWGILRYIISFLVLLTFFLSIYYLAPSKKLKLREIIIGATFATVGWIVVSLGFSYYVDNIANYTAKYGSLAGVIVMLIWFYLTALVVLIGGECNAIYKEFKDKD